jgi:NAD(P) transhydrogenase subunit alpha
MNIAVPREIVPSETRVALTPAVVALLKREGHTVNVQTGAGLAAGFTDDAFVQAGATIVATAAELYRSAELVVKVHPPASSAELGHEADALPEGVIYMGFLNAFTQPEALRRLAARKATVYAMEFVPRITRAQSMDALSSMATVGGYKAVLLAGARLPKMFPLLMTAAGTISPAQVLILGAGVAGLQAIATAKRLGAKVEAFDPRPAVREQVKSLGAGFVEMELPKDAETAGGYAKEMSAEFLVKEQEAIAARLPKMDVVIATAQVFGKRAPILVTAAMVKLMKPGAVIVDMAAEQGGNCELTQAGQTVETPGGVAIIGAVNLPATVPQDASLLYAKNLFNLIKHLFPKSGPALEADDEIAKGACAVRAGEIVHPALQGLKAKPTSP